MIGKRKEKARNVRKRNTFLESNMAHRIQKFLETYLRGVAAGRLASAQDRAEARKLLRKLDQPEAAPRYAAAQKGRAKK